jgi:transaldolase
MNPLDRLTALGTSVWVDALVGPVQLERLIREDGVTGLTSNPTILDHALTGGEAYPRYSDVKHVDELARPGVINTMPLATLAAFHDHGDPVDRLTDSAAAAKATLDAVRAAGVDLDSVTHQLLEDGVARFAASMDDLLLNLNNAALAA